MDELAVEFDGRAKVGKINATEALQTAMTYGIMGVPQIFIFKDGEPIQQFTGKRPKDDLKEALETAVSG